jgi:ketosteroid isomerase-like protein
MSNIDAVNALLTAINFDRFSEISARHAPDATFISFRGPTCRDSVAIGDWHRTFLKDYADCNYTDLEYIEDGDTVCVRATIEAKGYDWRAFTQRVLEVVRFADGEVVERRLYAMLRDVEFTKPVQQAMDNARGYRGGSVSATRKTVDGWTTAVDARDREAAKEFAADQAVAIDGVYGLAAGLDAIFDQMAAAPRPAFGVRREVGRHLGEHTAVLEFSYDTARPRLAILLRIVDGKVMVIERYWMLREIGVRPDENYANDRHQRQVILPI